MEKPGIIKRIFSVLLKIVVVILLMIAIAFGSFEGVTYYLTGSFYDIRQKVQQADATKQAEESQEQVQETINKDMENTLLFVDSEDEMHTYIFLSMLNKKTKALDFVLLPENAQVQLGRSLSKKIAKRLEGKSNAVELRDVERVYGAESYEIICEIMEELLNIKIEGWDHMTAKNAAAFLNIISPVDVEIKESISYRNAKGKLQVLEAGEIAMDGKAAVTYLSYLDGTSLQESNRLDRTMKYLETFSERLLTEKKAGKILEKYQKCVDSSEGRAFENLKDVLKSSDDDFLTLRILQGSESGDSFVIDNQKAQLQIATLAKQSENYNGGGQSEEDDDDEEKMLDGDGDSKDLSIEIYNAAYISGIAGAWEQFLEEEGYNITIVDSYQEEGPIATTRIVLEKEGIGEDLLQYFPDAEVTVGDISTGGDIQIYVGTDRTTVGVAQ